MSAIEFRWTSSSFEVVASPIEIRSPTASSFPGNTTLTSLEMCQPPPFSLDNWRHSTAEDDKFGRFRRRIPPRTKGDYAFILHMIETLKPKTGRMAVVVPHGVLFRGAAEGKIRQKLVQTFPKSKVLIYLTFTAYNKK